MRKNNGVRSARRAMNRADGIAFESFVSEHNARIAEREAAGVWGPEGNAEAETREILPGGKSASEENPGGE